MLSTTFDKYCYVSVRHLPRFFDYRNEIIYSKVERVEHTADILHPAIRNAMQMMDMHELRLTYDADLPARSGLGTSSSFAVGMLNAFHALKGKYADKRRLADEAIYLERVLCAETGGVQDQIAAAFGGPVVKTACCIGRQTAEEAAKHGFEEIRTAEKATLDSLIKTLEVDEK